jgi:hypothetical protein
MPERPQSDTTEWAACRVLLAGVALPDTAQIIEIEVQRAVGQIPGARIVLADGSTPDNEGWMADSGHVMPGTEIEIQAGDGQSLHTLFKGQIVSTTLGNDGVPACCLTLTCRDKAVALTGQARSEVFVNQTDSTVMQGLITRAGLAAQVDETHQIHTKLPRVHSSDWDFLLARARANGLLVITDDGTVHAQAPALDAAPALALTWGDDLHAFSLHIDAGQAGKPPAMPAQGRGTARFQGSALAKVGGMLALKGVGTRFGGSHLIVQLTHSLSKGAWLTEVGLGLGSSWQDDPSGAMVLRDQHGNLVKLDAQGITLDSPQDITLNAKGKISLAAVGDLHLASSSGNLLSQALHITCDAQIGFDAKGGATAKLSASGQTTVQGAIVMIN